MYVFGKSDGLAELMKKIKNLPPFSLLPFLDFPPYFHNSHIMFAFLLLSLSLFDDPIDSPL